MPMRLQVYLRLFFLGGALEKIGKILKKLEKMDKILKKLEKIFKELAKIGQNFVLPAVYII